MSSLQFDFIEDDAQLCFDPIDEDGDIQIRGYQDGAIILYYLPMENAKQLVKFLERQISNFENLDA